MSSKNRFSLRVDFAEKYPFPQCPLMSSKYNLNVQCLVLLHQCFAVSSVFVCSYFRVKSIFKAERIMHYNVPATVKNTLMHMQNSLLHHY